MTRWAEALMSDPKRAALPIMTHPGIELLGKKVIDAVTDGEVHAATIVALNERYPAAGATVIMDLTVEAEAFGAEIAFEEDDIPNVVGRLLTNAEDVANLTIPPLTAGRVQKYLKASYLASERIADKPLFGGCIGPFSLAGRLYDMTEIMMALYTEPETATTLLEKCTEFILGYCRAQKEAGVSGIILAEPAAGLLSNEDCVAYSSVYIKRIVDELQDENLMIVLHNCGNTGHCTPAMVATGARALHFGNKIDMVQALQDVPAGTLAMGNLDPVAVFKQATPEQMYATATDLLERTKGCPNFVLSSGCDTPPHTPLANIDAFYRALGDFNAKL
jgi:uroporphyrinogen decarboxylase